MLTVRMTVLVALAFAGQVGVARAADPVAPRIGGEQGPEAKAERVLKSLSATDAEAWRARLKSGEVLRRDFLHRYLLETNAGYKAAVATFDKEGGNVEEFAKLATSTDRGPSGDALRAHAAFFMGRAFLNRDEFALAGAAFDLVRKELKDGTAWTDEATLYLGYSYARRPELEEDKERLLRTKAKACLETLIPEDGSKPVYAQAPERTREAAGWLLKELKGEGSGPLLELARRMDTVEHAIDRESTGKATQKKEDQIIAELDRLIELMREKEQNGNGNGKGGGRGGKGGRNPSGPAKRSGLPPARDPGQVNEIKKAGTGDWGAMKESERKAALQLLKDRFPERYREIIEEYFKVIEDDAGPSKPKPAEKPTEKPGEKK
ncbi:hypothetical protein HY251_05835 [bacterium]|nr:hypothetical protein [bacterium]